ncbi:hypothetical protein D187_004033 [Cystobacter fuscus DSM 2262]|uniref:Uncharacterized protein n=1 Tax=Cystobacter fuscus (strain ATCC 25194 / DSM 2262 / NBRC 100088 / M29) TaxID=1242864 RepID=S9P7S6_CYSF2|nr:hypothetical protein D187_004033 [Cystobacter fuscus DSM 2262]
MLRRRREPEGADASQIDLDGIPGMARVQRGETGRRDRDGNPPGVWKGGLWRLTGRGHG